jgi:hypothetical protein
MHDILFVPVRLSDQIIEGSIAHTIMILIDYKLQNRLLPKSLRSMVSPPASLEVAEVPDGIGDMIDPLSFVGVAGKFWLD